MDTSVSALAQQTSAANETLVAQSAWSFEDRAVCWLPQHYALVPLQALGFLVYQCARSPLDTMPCPSHVPLPR